jgi:hypothetical protein
MAVVPASASGSASAAVPGASSSGLLVQSVAEDVVWGSLLNRAEVLLDRARVALENFIGEMSGVHDELHDEFLPAAQVRHLLSFDLLLFGFDLITGSS